MTYDNGYINGYIERKPDKSFAGTLSVDGVKLDGIVGEYFKEDGVTHLWLKRKPLLEYDAVTQTYVQRPREPRWEAYLQKQQHDTIAYKGTFKFLHFCYSIVGIWDKVLGMEKQRMNFYIERLPMNEQTIINSINERKKNLHE